MFYLNTFLEHFKRYLITHLICLLVIHSSLFQDRETDSLNYAALDFPGRKTKRGKKQSERPQESVYSAVRETAR